MKKAIFLTSLSLFLFSCGTSKVVKKEIIGNYTNLIFTPQYIDKSLDRDLSLRIEPIDAKELNVEIYETMMRDGGYEKQLYSSDIFVEEKLSRKEKQTLKQYKKIEIYINDILNEGRINKQVAFLFKERVINSLFGSEFGTPGFDGSEIHTSLGNNRYSEFNPYRINSNYLSLFRFYFDNKSNNIQSVDLENFQVSDNKELLYPFKNEYFEKNWKDDSEKMKFIYRMNMPDRLTLTPSQQTLKYISLPAINPNSKEINVSYINGNEVVIYPFELNIETITEKIVYTLYNLELDKKWGRSLDIQQYLFLVETEDNDLFPLRDNKVYINETEKNKPIKIHVLYTPLSGEKYDYMQSTVTPSRFAKHKIKLPIEKENN